MRDELCIAGSEGFGAFRCHCAGGANALFRGTGDLVHPQENFAIREEPEVVLVVQRHGGGATWNPFAGLAYYASLVFPQRSVGLVPLIGLVPQHGFTEAFGHRGDGGAEGHVLFPGGPSEAEGCCPVVAAQPCRGAPCGGNVVVWGACKQATSVATAGSPMLYLVDTDACSSGVDPV